MRINKQKWKQQRTSFDTFMSIILVFVLSKIFAAKHRKLCLDTQKLIAYWVKYTIIDNPIRGKNYIY